MVQVQVRTPISSSSTVSSNIIYIHHADGDDVIREGVSETY